MMMFCKWKRKERFIKALFCNEILHQLKGSVEKGDESFNSPKVKKVFLLVDN